jgi:hypothetical protein
VLEGDVLSVTQAPHRGVAIEKRSVEVEEYGANHWKPSSVVRLTILPFSGERVRERSTDRSSDRNGGQASSASISHTPREGRPRGHSGGVRELKNTRLGSWSRPAGVVFSTADTLPPYPHDRRPTSPSAAGSVEEMRTWREAQGTTASVADEAPGDDEQRATEPRRAPRGQRGRRCEHVPA